MVNGAGDVAFAFRQEQITTSSERASVEAVAGATDAQIGPTLRNLIQKRYFSLTSRIEVVQTRCP
jgi:hypothetical protein